MDGPGTIRLRKSSRNFAAHNGDGCVVFWYDSLCMYFLTVVQCHFTKLTDTAKELFTGHIPYAHIPIEVQVMVAIIKGILPTLPDLIHGTLEKKAMDLCHDCWKYNPTTRPSMSKIAHKLRTLCGLDTQCTNDHIPKHSDHPDTVDKRKTQIAEDVGHTEVVGHELSFSSSSTTNPLDSILGQLSHLNLTGRIKIKEQIATAGGGYSDVFIGYVRRGTKQAKVAVRQFRSFIISDRDVKKVCLLICLHLDLL